MKRCAFPNLSVLNKLSYLIGVRLTFLSYIFVHKVEFSHLSVLYKLSYLIGVRLTFLSYIFFHQVEFCLYEKVCFPQLSFA